LPVQSGSSEMLEKMNRGYTRECYLERVAAIKHYMPDCEMSTDIITGFCGETDEDHAQTVSLMKESGFIMSYMFKYSERPKTLAERKFKDDVPEEVKAKRLQEVIDLQHELSHQSNLKDIGKTFEVLVESVSKRSTDFYSGRNTHNKVVIFPKGNYKKGDYVHVTITECSSATLKGVLA
jgi:tRNA-2-methylthio-N6-dimethylallyladenosine synthase